MLRRQLIRQFFSPPSPAPPRPPRGFGTDGSRAVVTNQRRSKHGEEQTHPNGETSVGCKGATEECRSRNANSARHDPIEFQAGNGDCAPESPPGNHGTSDHEGNRLAAAFSPRLFCRVVRKRLGLPLKSEKSDGERHYRIVARKAPRSGAEDGPSFRKMATIMPMADATERIRYTRCASVRGEAIPEKAVSAS